MTRLEAIKHVRAYIDNALSMEPFEITPDVTLVGYDLEGHDGPVFVACRSYMMDTAGDRDVLDDETELATLAVDALNDTFPGSFEEGDPISPEYLIVGAKGAPTPDEITDVLSDLCEWDATVGQPLVWAWQPSENEVWDRARDLLERLLDMRMGVTHHAKLVALENDRDGEL